MRNGNRKNVFLSCLLSTALVLLFVSGISLSEEKKGKPTAGNQESAAPPAEKQKDAEEQAPKVQPAETNPAARVNGVAISRKELDRSYNAFIQQQGMDTGMITDPDRYRQVQMEVLDGLIARELLWQEAKKKNHVATDEAVAQTMAEVKSKFPSEEEFNLRLAQTGITEEDYARFLRRELSIRELVQKDIAGELAVSDDEVHEFYESNPGQFESPEQVRARHILVKVDPNADEKTKDAARKKIEGVLSETKGGADFAEMAKKHSEGPSGPNGGDLGFFSRGQMVKPFADAAFALEPGEISNVVQTMYGYHIIKVEEKRESRTMAEEDVKDQVRQYLLSRKVQEAAQERVNTLRSEGDVEILIGN